MKYLRPFVLMAFLSLSFGKTRAQSLEDIYDYSVSGMHGTARYLGTGGSLMSLGADFSAVADNPAGAVFFLTNRITYSPGTYNKFNNSRYGNQLTASNDAGIYHNLLYSNQIGIVAPFLSDRSDWNKIALGANYQTDKNYYNRVNVSGPSLNGKSLADYFLWHAQGIPTGDLNVGLLETTDGVYEWLGENYGSSAQHAFLAYQAYLINPVTNNDNNTLYTSNAQFNDDPRHQLTITTSGKKGFADLFFAAQYRKKLSLGIAYRYWHTVYIRKTIIDESGYSASSGVQWAAYQTRLHAENEGHSLVLGATYALTPRIKVSASLHSPVWWTVSESFSEAISTDVRDTDDVDNDGDTNEIFSYDVAPQSVNTYAPYRMITPAKYMLGASAVLGKNGFVAVSYAFKDWRKTHLSATGDDMASQQYFDALNSEIARHFAIERSLALGGEFRLDKMTLRAGYHYATNPVEGLPENKSLSFGLGYDFGSVEVDFGMINSDRTQKSRIFPVGLDNAYRTSSRINRYVVSVRINY